MTKKKTNRRNAPDGSTYTSQNGYHYTKKDGDWKLTHHVLAAEKYGHPVDTSVHRVSFIDKDKTNLDPDNIQLTQKKRGKVQRREILQQRIALLEEELRALGS